MKAVEVTEIYEPGQKCLAHYRKQYKDMLKIMRILDTDWPIANQTYSHLFSYIPNAVLVDGEPLAYRCLNSGLTQYESALGQKDETRFQAFLEGLVKPAVEVFRTICFKTDKSNKWCAECGEPLSKFLDECSKLPNARPVPSKRKEPVDVDHLSTAIKNYLLGLENG